MAAGLVLGFMLFTFGVIGGGDGKLMGAIGSIGGLRFFAEALAWTLLIGMVVSILVLAWKKALFPLLRRLIKAGWEAIRWQLEPSEAIVEGEGHRIPFAIVIGTGSVAALIAETAGLRLFAGF